MIRYRPTIMVTRRSPAALALLLCLAGCAGNTGTDAASSSSSAPASSSAGPAPASSAPTVSAPTASAPTVSAPAGEAQTITGTVEAGVEPNCRLIKDGKGSHLLVFQDSSLRAQAEVGQKITATGRSEPKMMSTCQQGIPFIVASITPA